MTINVLDELTDPFREKVEAMLAVIRSAGMAVKPYYGLRSPFEQAKLWRQSRTWDEIEQEMEKLKAAGAHKLAACIGSVGPRRGPRVTNAIPGFSWHQYGEAVDSFVVDSYGKAQWDANDRGYAVMARAARTVGLKPGYDFGDPVHVQMHQQEPHQVYSLGKIEDILSQRWEDFGKLG